MEDQVAERKIFDVRTARRARSFKLVPEPSVVRLSLEGGINLFDTSNMYSNGMSEEILGEALGARRS